MKETVFLIRNVSPEKYGGGEVYQLVLAKKLTEAGFLPIIVTNSSKLLNQAEHQKIKTIRPPYIKRQNWSGLWNFGLSIYYLYQLRMILWYKMIFEEYNPKIVNIQSRDDWIAATIAAKKKNIRILWTDHADFKNWVFNNVTVRFKNIIGKRIIKLSKYAEKVIFVSEIIKKETIDMIKPYAMNNAIVIENGVEDKYSDYKHIKPKKQSLIFLGRVVEEKGMTELIRAFESINNMNKNVTLNIYGDGKISFYKKMIGDNKNIIFHGNINNPLRALAENEIFILPSYMEGMSLSLLEAMMMKKTIIVTDAGGNTEVIKNNESGLIAKRKNVESLIRELTNVLENSEKARKLAIGARKRYEEKFDIDKIFKEKMLSLYQNGDNV